MSDILWVALVEWRIDSSEMDNELFTVSAPNIEQAEWLAQVECRFYLIAEVGYKPAQINGPTTVAVHGPFTRFEGELND